jgi:hypothetical protein
MNQWEGAQELRKATAFNRKGRKDFAKNAKKNRMLVSPASNGKEFSHQLFEEVGHIDRLPIYSSLRPLQ